MSLHADATAVLRHWEAPDPPQDTLRRHYLAHLTSHADATYRWCRPDHLTASILIVSADHEQVLLTLHRRIGRWLQTGGHCEERDQHVAAAALREGREESGIADLLLVGDEPVLLSHHEVPCGPVSPAHHLDVQYVATAAHGAEPVISEESTDLRWFGVDALPEGTDDSVRALVRHARRRLASVVEELR